MFHNASLLRALEMSCSNGRELTGWRAACAGVRAQLQMRAHGDRRAVGPADVHQGALPLSFLRPSLHLEVGADQHSCLKLQFLAWKR